MVRLSRRKGITSVVLLSLCLGVTGCLNMFDEQPIMQNNYSQNQRPTYPTYPGMPANPANPGGVPNGQGYAAMPTGPQTMNPANGSIKQAQLTLPPQPGEQPGEQPMMGAPMVDVHGPIAAVVPNLPQPTELQKYPHPPHRVAAPDILHIEALRLVPKGPYKLEAMEVLSLEVTDTLPKQDIKGLYMISPEGSVNLGFNYGMVRLGGLTLEQAQAALRSHLAPILKNPIVNVALVQMRGLQNVKGEHLVRPDGTISLGMYGSVFVAGLDLGQVKCTIENHLSAYLVDPQIAVDVFAYNSRKIYIVASGAGYGEQVIILPATGNETVLDAIGRVQGLPQVASLKKIWVARPSPVGTPCSTILPVDWHAITQAGRTETNYQLLPGDRIYVSADPLIALYNWIDKIVSPIERVLGVALLAGTTVQTFGSGGTTGAVLVR